MNRVLFGPVKLNKTFMAVDLTYKEVFMFLPFIFFVFFFGIYPNIFIEKYEFLIYNLI